MKIKAGAHIIETDYIEFITEIFNVPDHSFYIHFTSGERVKFISKNETDLKRIHSNICAKLGKIEDVRGSGDCESLINFV